MRVDACRARPRAPWRAAGPRRPLAVTHRREQPPRPAALQPVLRHVERAVERDLAPRREQGGGGALCEVRSPPSSASAGATHAQQRAGAHIRCSHAAWDDCSSRHLQERVGGPTPTFSRSHVAPPRLGPQPRPRAPRTGPAGVTITNASSGANTARRCSSSGSSPSRALRLTSRWKTWLRGSGPGGSADAKPARPPPSLLPSRRSVPSCGWRARDGGSVPALGRAVRGEVVGQGGLGLSVAHKPQGRTATAGRHYTLQALGTQARSIAEARLNAPPPQKRATSPLAPGAPHP